MASESVDFDSDRGGSFKTSASTVSTSSSTAVDVSISPNSSVILEPSDQLSFQLQPQSSPQAVFTIRNVSETRKIAFKVKTTRPMRYLVRPNQGMLGPNGTTCINVILQQKDCDELVRLAPSERLLSNDKFLVQSIYIDDSFYELVKSKSTKEMADELTHMWTSTDRKQLANKKLRCRFLKDDEGDALPTSSTSTAAHAATSASATAANSTTGAPATLSSSSSAAAMTAHSTPMLSTSSSAGLLQTTSPRDQNATEPNPLSSSSGTGAASFAARKPSEISTTSQLTAALLEEHTASHGKREGVVSPSNKESLQEIAALRKKYDELVAFTVQLTAQRDVLISDLDKTRQQLQKVSADAQRVKKHGLLEENTLRQRKTASSSSSGAHDSSSSVSDQLTKGDAHPFGLFHLVVCAIIFFLVGRYY